MNLKEYFQDLENYYYDGISYSNSRNERELLNQVPKQLEEFYSQYDDMVFPYGRIYSIEKALEMSNRLPFKKDNWFCFGQDNYSVFWLCKKGVGINEFAFTMWDHEVESNIEEASFRSLKEVLVFLTDEYNNSGLDMCDIIITGCDSNGLKELMQIKKIFLSPLSIADIKSQVVSGECIIRKNINFYEANRILLEYKFEHITVSVRKTE